MSVYKHVAEKAEAIRKEQTLALAKEALRVAARAVDAASWAADDSEPAARVVALLHTISQQLTEASITEALGKAEVKH